jgi:hypothetical protein
MGRAFVGARRTRCSQSGHCLRIHSLLCRYWSQCSSALACMGMGSSWLEKAFANFKRRVQKLTGRSWGVSLGYGHAKLAEYVRGGMGCFGISEYYRSIPEIDHWLRRRMRMCSWNRPVRTRMPGGGGRAGQAPVLTRLWLLRVGPPRDIDTVAVMRLVFFIKFDFVALCLDDCPSLLAISVPAKECLKVGEHWLVIIVDPAMLG